MLIQTQMILLSLLKHNFYPPRALFRLLDTLSHIIIAIKFATNLNTKHKEFLLSFQSISWSSFYPHSWNSMSCFTGQYNNTMSLSILCVGMLPSTNTFLRMFLHTVVQLSQKSWICFYSVFRQDAQCGFTVNGMS